jgi:hypothetical protein
MKCKPGERVEDPIVFIAKRQFNRVFGREYALVEAPAVEIGGDSKRAILTMVASSGERR